jgi:hypothetical protein
VARTQVGTWNVLVGCGHMHGQHATTESTQLHNILCSMGASLGREVAARGRPEDGLLWVVGAMEMWVNVAI